MWKRIVFCGLVCAGLLVGCKQMETKKVYDPQTNKLLEEYQVRKKNGQRNGAAKKYDGAGNLLEESVYKDDQLHGVRKIYFASGQVMVEENYSFDNFEGAYKTFFENGKVESEGVYHNNSMTGIWQWYYANGQLKEQVNFENNAENGPFTEYFENGKLAWEGTYKDGDHEHGLLKKYDESGALIRILMCEMGVCHTKWTTDSSATPPPHLLAPSVPSGSGGGK
jgi:antitoxin component YwqK of YwqJK toxin-antitoxin module